MPEISVSDDFIERLKKHAEPFVDTHASALVKILDSYEQLIGEHALGKNGSPKTYDPAVPPNLAHTVIQSATVGKMRLNSSNLYWNHILIYIVKLASKTLNAKDISESLTCNNVVGKKTVDGYKYVEDAGISIQGQDANGAWRGAYDLIKTLNISVDIKFSWNSNPKASHPGEEARFVITK